MKETWKPVFGGVYSVSSRGRVRRVAWHQALRGDGVLRPTWTRRGYALVTLSVNGRLFYRLVHRLVAEAFHGPARGREVDHINGEKHDNSARNLEWVSHLENTRRACVSGAQVSGARHPSAAFTKEQAAEIRRRYRPGSPWHPGNGAALAQKFGVHISTVQAVGTGRRY